MEKARKGLTWLSLSGTFPRTFSGKRPETKEKKRKIKKLFEAALSPRQPNGPFLLAFPTRIARKRPQKRAFRNDSSSQDQEKNCLWFIKKSQENDIHVLLMLCAVKGYKMGP